MINSEMRGAAGTGGPQTGAASAETGAAGVEPGAASAETGTATAEPGGAGGETGGPVALITLDRHERRNALDTSHCDALGEAVGKAVDAGARAVVITGAGSSFCAGADLTGVYGGDFRRSLYGMLHVITGAPVPVVAAVNGPAVGAGTQLAIACDLRVAAPAAWFAVPTARHGLAVDPWTIRRLALLGGGGAARALLLGCASLDAELARQRGLVDRVGGLDDALAWAGEISSFAPESLAYSKRALEALQEPRPWDPAIDTAYEAVWRRREQAREQGRAPG